MRKQDDKVHIITREYDFVPISTSRETISWNMNRIAEDAILQLQTSRPNTDGNVFWVVQRASTLHRKMLEHEKTSLIHRSLYSSSILGEINGEEPCEYFCELSCFMSNEAFRLKHKKQCTNWQSALTTALEFALIAASHHAYVQPNGDSLLTVLRYISASR